MTTLAGQFIQTLLDPEEGEEPTPGSPADRFRQYRDGPWFQTQLGISALTGLASLLAFCYLRRRSKVFYAPRQLLQDFQAHEAHSAGEDSFFGWILPTLRISELAVLQLVGLDATVLLSFFKLGFQLFTVLSFLGCTLLMPLNWRELGSIDGVPPTKHSRGSHPSAFASQGRHEDQEDLLSGTDLLLTSHFIFTALFTLITLLFLHRTYSNFIRHRQLFSLDLAQTIPARTVLLQNIPPHLQQDRLLGEYFQKLNLDVESVSVVRQVGRLADLLQDRTLKLRQLETAWAKFLGNPTRLPDYNRDTETAKILQSTGPVTPPATLSRANTGQLIEHDAAREAHEDLEAARRAPSPRPFPSSDQLEIPGKKRPTVRPGWFSKSVDALDYYRDQFLQADEVVRKARKGKFRPTGVAFVTFESAAAAQVAAQVVHSPSPNTMITKLAPEPRDVHWGNLVLSRNSTWLRRAIVLALGALTLLFWGAPVSQLARLLSFDTIWRLSPGLGRLIQRFPVIQGFVQTSLPSLALIGFNALLPYLLEGYSYFEGSGAKSWIEYSLLKKYYLFLIINVLFIVVSVSTVTLARDLAGEPLKVMQKLATTLPAARNFYVAYVMLQGLGIIPLQLLSLGPVISSYFFRVFCRTPRDYAEINAPPVLNLGVIYPQALVIFVIGLTYSIVMPLILPFTAIYFGMSYLVYKYRLLNVFHRPFESRGQAWPIAFNRIAVGMLIFQIFMTGLFTVRGAFPLSTLMAVLIAVTAYSCFNMYRKFHGLARYVNLQQACEVQRDEEPSNIQQLKRGHPVTTSQTKLSRSRYEKPDDSVFVVSDDPKENSVQTDYIQPPLSDVFVGILNTGRRRYGHPALSGQLPLPWLPVTLRPSRKGSGLVINVRRRWSIVKGGARRLAGTTSYPPRPGDEQTRSWREGTRDVERQEESNGGAHGSFGVVPIEEAEQEEEVSEGEEEEGSKYRTFFVKSNPPDEPGTHGRSAVEP